jgi:GWxTD domain-containing protein
MNPKYLIILFLALASCKTTQKVKTGSVAGSARTQRTTTDATQAAEKEPVISTVNTRYIVEDSTNVNVYLELTVDNFDIDATTLKRFATRYRVSWLLVNDYSIRERIKNGRIELDENTFSYSENKIYLRFQIPRAKGINNAILITEFVDINASKKFTIDLPIDFIESRFVNRFGIFKEKGTLPSFETYVKMGEPITFKATKEYERPFYLIRYIGEDDPARSPMSTSKPSVVSFEKLSVSKFTTGKSITLTEPGLYFAAEDTTDLLKGSGFYVVDTRYPRFTMPDELIEPIVYISTNKEIETIKAAESTKDALDLFFLGVTDGNQKLSKEIIRTYYRRVAESNRLFTSYKEGWKTDKGMVYIVLGPPSKVQRFRDREVWLYSQSENFSEIIFTFYRTENQFTDNYYELVRYPDYKQYWYPYVEAWRDGKIIE